jgi:ankyrin repeat protein
VFEELDEATGAVTRRFAKEDEDAADPSTMNFAQLYGCWIARAKTLQEVEEILKERNYNINDRDQNGETALHLTCKAANVDIARYLLENGADPTARDNDGLTPLHIAAAYISDSDIFDLLLVANRNVDIDASDESGMTALHFATATSNVTCARFLLSNGANPNTRNQNGSTPLHFAAMFAKDMDIVELLVNHKDVDAVNCLDNSELNALMHCATFNENGHGERIVNLLREKRASAEERNILNGSLIIWDGDQPDREDVQHFYLSHRERMLGSREKEGQSVDYVDFFNDDKVKIEDKIEKMFLIRLDNAMANSDVEKVRHLIEMGAELSKATWGGGRNALHAASKYVTKTELLDVILATGIFDVNSRDENGHTALRFAVDANSVENVRHLLEQGADPTISDNDGFTPFHMAAAFNKDSEILILLSLATDGNTFEMDERNKFGLTALHLATYASNVTAARLLLSNGADPNVTDKNGATPLHVAAIFAKDMQVVELLVNHPDVDVNCLDNWGRNALDHARKNTNGQSDKISELLKEKGAVETEVENKPEKVEKAALALRNAITDSEVETIRNLLTTAQGLDIISAVIWGEEGMNALHLASRHAKTTDVIDVVLETGKFDINGVDNDGKTPLHYAVEGSDRAIIVPHLIEKGADPNIGEKGGITPVHVAAALNRDLDILDRLVSAYENVNVNQCDCDGLTALHSAALASNVTAARILLSKGANPNAALQNGVTPLHLAAKFAKDIDIVELLLNHEDTNVNYSDNIGRKALDYATINESGLGERIVNLLKEKDAVDEAGIENKSENIVALVFNAIKNSNVETTRNLIENGYDISTATWEEGMNALHLASYYAETTDLIDVVLETRKFDINGGDNSGRTPLHYAINGTSHAIIAWVQRRTDPNIFDTKNDARTSIHHITANNETDMDFIREINANRNVIVGYLMGKGADPTIRDNHGITALHVAATGITNTDILDSLLANGKVDVNDSSKSGLTALHMAVAEHNVTATRFLLSNGANPNAAEENGLTPLHVAANYARDMDIIELLLNHKDVNVNYLNNRGQNALHCARNNFHGLGEAITNLLREKMAGKAEGYNHEPENITALVPPGRIKEDSDIKTIRFLIESGQDISAMTWGENGSNALHLAAANAKTTDVIDVILETGEFDINGGDNDGRTPLHYAIKRPDPVTINARRLIKLGANPGIADKNRVTPLHMAARNAESMDLIELLLNTEAVDVNCVDKQGRTPLDCARANKHGLGEKIIARLTEYDQKEW